LVTPMTDAQSRKCSVGGAATAEHLKFVLKVVDGPNSPGRSPAYEARRKS
jgi:hypothetical protein